MVSAAPIAASAITESQMFRDSANTMVASPKAITAWNIRKPARRAIGWRAMIAVMQSAPTAGAARITPSAQGPACKMSLA